MTEAFMGAGEVEAEDQGNRLALVRGSEIEPREVEWLWPSRIPRGKVSILDGLPDVGKTTLLIDVAACITAGRSLPDGTTPVRGTVVFLGFEDDAADTIVPRFLAAGGDAEALFVGDSKTGPLGPSAITVPEDADLLREFVAAQGVVMLVIDPIMGALSAGVRTGIDSEVRSALQPLRVLAESTGAAVVMTRHVNKDIRNTSPILRGGGSIAFSAFARSVMMAGKDPDDPEHRRVLAMVKRNLANGAVPSLSYSLEEDATRKAARVVWHGTTRATASEILIADAGEEEPKGALGDAMSVLEEFLAGGPKRALEAKAYCKEAGIAPRTLDRAKDRLGVCAAPQVTDGSHHWVWTLPGGLVRQ